jgi:hypothetical protein
MGIYPRGIQGSRPDVISLTVPEVQDLRSRMSVGPTEEVQPRLAQFLPESRELWIDYMTWAARRFRLRLKLSDNGERFRLVGIEEHALDKNLPALGVQNQFEPDTPLDPICDRLEFNHRVRWSDRRGFALLVDPKHPSAVESIEGWRVRSPEGPDPDRIYLVLHGERRLIPTIETYQHLFGRPYPEDIHLLGKNFGSLPEGDPLSDDAALWRLQNDYSKVYLFDTGEFHLIKGFDTLKKYGFEMAPMHDTSASFLKGRIGEPIGPL